MVPTNKGTWSDELFHIPFEYNLVYGEEEWSFGYCENGTGVFTCPPGWVNRFANAGDAAMVVAENTAFRLQQAKTEIVTASKVAYRFIAGLASNSNSSATPESPGNSNRSSRTFQGTWFRNLLSVGAKPSDSASEVPKGDNDTLPLQQQKSMEQHQLSSKHNI
uniref:Uncharacterized protein LOC105043533 n=1 Tax=Elaeis guineensis var. tenera TaxID=51953 RepID=A0A8N4EW39_ELAGV|nr:uncharacterized protein LOC105043533 [Elaeis guineensis]